MDWQRWIARLAVGVEDRVDRAKTELDRKVRRGRPARIDAYRGYGTAEVVRVHARVLFGRRPAPSSPDDRWWHNLVGAYRRLETDDVPGARVRVRFQDGSREVVAGPEGHIRTTIPVSVPLPPDQYWHDVHLELLDPAGDGATAPVALPSSPAFGVISDLDDTVLQTGTRNLIRMAREVLFGNAHSRIPFPGVGAFYRALHTSGQNPIFYVSSSPWNLYDVLSQFLHLHRIPAGPMELRDWGLSAAELFPTSHQAHKRKAIDRILESYPGLPFILVGDSGQEDPEIYRGVVHDYPSRILAIYIRNVSPELSRQEAVRGLATELAVHDVDLVLVDDTIDAADHAVRRGWIDPSATDAVARDREWERQSFSG